MIAPPIQAWIHIENSANCSPFHQALAVEEPASATTPNACANGTNTPMGERYDTAGAGGAGGGRVR